MRSYLPTFGICLCCLLTCLSGDDEHSVPEDAGPESYVLTKDQLIALQDLSSWRVRFEYTWDVLAHNDSWAASPPAPLDEREQKRTVPIYGVKGHAWLTRDATLKTLLAFPDLQAVDLAYCCNFTDEGVSHLAGLKSLRTLVMYRNSARFAGNLMEGFGPKHEIAEKLPQRLTDKAMEHICTMLHLESLYIWDNEFSEQAILKLGQIKTLKRLGIQDWQISDEGLAHLRAMLPECQFEGISVQRGGFDERPKGLWGRPLLDDAVGVGRK
jgi:hypothetical protein